MGISRRVLLVACLLTLSATHAFAGCEAETCEFNCRERCRRDLVVGNYVDNVCFNGCLSSEHACKAALPAARTACQGNWDYQRTLESARAARRLGILKSEAECKNFQSWTRRYVEQVGGEIAGQITGACKCFLCEAAMSGGAGPIPVAPSSPVAPGRRSSSCEFFPNTNVCMCIVNEGSGWTGPGQPICATEKSSGPCSCTTPQGFMPGTVKMKR